MENLKIVDTSVEDSSRTEQNDSRNLSEIFENGLSIFTSILETTEATNSFKIQVCQHDSFIVLRLTFLFVLQ